MTAAGVLASCALSTTANAQSADSLIDKLVDKGILTVKEAQELRNEADKDFTRAYSVKSGMPDWVTSFKINGDFRGRYEGFYADNSAAGVAFVDRNRFRYRARLGFTAVMKDSFEVGLRLTSSERSDNFGGDPISGNTSFADNGSKKFVFIDLAYAKWDAINTADLAGSLTIGKMANPFVFSDMVFDGDYTPEGAAIQLAYKINPTHHVLKFNAGGFVLDELGGSSNDPYLLGAQLRFDSTWTPHIASSVGVAVLGIWGPESLTNGGVPNSNVGNTRTSTAAGGFPVFEYNPVVADAALTYTLESFPYYKAPFPITLAGDYMHNPAAPTRNTGYSAGITFGKSGKKGLWDISYRYKYLEGDAWFEELVDSDFGAFYGVTAPTPGRFVATGYRAGTNVKGHIIKASYSPYDSLTLGMTLFLTELIDEPLAAVDSNMTRLQVDAAWKF